MAPGLIQALLPLALIAAAIYFVTSRRKGQGATLLQPTFLHRSGAWISAAGLIAAIILAAVFGVEAAAGFIPILLIGVVFFYFSARRRQGAVTLLDGVATPVRELYRDLPSGGRRARRQAPGRGDDAGEAPAANQLMRLAATGFLAICAALFAFGMQYLVGSSAVSWSIYQIGSAALMFLALPFVGLAGARAPGERLARGGSAIGPKLLVVAALGLSSFAMAEAAMRSHQFGDTLNGDGDIPTWLIQAAVAFSLALAAVVKLFSRTRRRTALDD